MSVNGLRPYPAYRESGLDWLGRVPDHWEARRVATIADMRVSNVDKHVREEEEPIRLCNYVDVYHNDRIRRDIAFMPATAKKAEIQRFRVAIGDVLLTKDSEDWTDIGVPALVEYAASDLVCGYHLAMLRPNGSFLDARYLLRALGSPGVARQFHVAANGVTRYGLSRHGIRSVRIPLPPVVEQHAIARYLDHADRRIRRYIRAKEQLIELLEERKRALIHEAVTGRIDVRSGQPYPAYKDSGVEWLGQVPEHWEVRRVANIADLRVSNVDKHVREEEEPIRLCNYVDVYHNNRIRGDIAFMPATARKAEIQRFRVAIGDVLLTKDSEDWTDIGVPTLVEYAAADLVCGYHLAMLRPNGAFLDAGYLFRALGDSGVARQFQVAANGVTRYGLSRHAIRSVRIPLPPVVGQRAIVRFLDRADRRIQRHVSATERQIALLRQYRTRLIADVVTGKIDVREAAARLPDADPVAGGSPSGTIHTESNLQASEYDTAKEAGA